MDEEKSFSEEEQSEVVVDVETSSKQGKLSVEEEENLARVEFRPAKAKDIVSAHTGSILQYDGPIIALGDEDLPRARAVFDKLAPPEKEKEAVEAEVDENDEPIPTQPSSPHKPRRIAIHLLSQAVYDCGVCPIDISSLEDPEQDPEPEPIYDDDGELIPQDSPPPKIHPLKQLISSIINKLLFNEDHIVGPSQTMDIEGFVYFIGKFHTPQFYYGQRFRRATGRGCIDDVLELLIRGIDVNCGDGEGLTSLHYACEFNRLELIEKLHEYAGERLMLNARCKAGWTPLYTACHHNNPKVVQLLLRLGADISLGTKYGKTPLHAAAGQGFSDIVNILLEDENCNPNIQCTSGMTALHDSGKHKFKCKYRCYWQYCPQ
jgi:hypothetical protein